MLGWAVGFFVLSIVAAVFGFGGVASAFAGLAQVLFFLFIILFALSFVIGLFTGGAHGGPAITGGSRTLGFIALAAVMAIGVFAWVDNDWSAERLGRAIDQRAVAVRQDTSTAFREVGDKTERFVERTGDDIEQNSKDLAKDHES